MRSVVVVPARLQSSRLPRKVMADIGGRPMLLRVLQRCRQAHSPLAVVLCTDSNELMAEATAWGFLALATSPACSSGSDRIASVVEKIVALSGVPATETLILNVQADHPFVDPATIDALCTEFHRRGPATEVLTPIFRIGNAGINDPNVVKALVAVDGRALCFSRAAIPHVRGVDPAEWETHASHWGHMGIYAFRADVLANWHKLPHSPLEALEQLEQMRLLEAGIRIDTVVVEGETLAVDTPEQLTMARALAASQEG